MLEICTFAASNNPTYDGAKEYFFIDVVDDRDYLSALVRETCKALPQPKPKKKKAVSKG